MSITANELKTKGVSAIESNLSDNDELIIVAGEQSGRMHFLKLEEPQKEKDQRVSR